MSTRGVGIQPAVLHEGKWHLEDKKIIMYTPVWSVHETGNVHTLNKHQLITRQNDGQCATTVPHFGYYPSSMETATGTYNVQQEAVELQLKRWHIRHYSTMDSECNMMEHSPMVV